ncbi:hypothetical protein ACIBG4_42140 [Nonomuraea sp. NPDC050383]|uniref:hypothetical protein n=1 Tax=Nonomuraea sp. NPDC050383 TaxID=3364362 RepID=UPI0037B080B1
MISQLTEVCDVYLARRIAARFAETRPDGDGGLDLSLGEVAERIAADADPAGWEEIHLHGRRDILTACAQRLAAVQHRHLPDKPETRADVTKMIRDTFSIGGNLWVLADEELREAGSAFERVRMLPDSVDQSPRGSSPTNIFCRQGPNSTRSAQAPGASRAVRASTANPRTAAVVATSDHRYRQFLHSDSSEA